MHIQYCYTEKLFKLQICWISIVGRCLVSTYKKAYCWIGWVGIASAQVSGRVLNSGIWVSNYPTRPIPIDNPHTFRSPVVYWFFINQIGYTENELTFGLSASSVPHFSFGINEKWSNGTLFVGPDVFIVKKRLQSPYNEIKNSSALKL